MNYNLKFPTIHKMNNSNVPDIFVPIRDAETAEKGKASLR
jgi:hypothetical protein